MASGLDLRRAGAGLLATLCTAALVWSGTGLEPLWPMLWLAPLPVLAFAARASWRAAALAATSAWFLGGLNLWHYFHGVLEIPAFVVLPILLVLALVFASAVLLFRALLTRGRVWGALFGFPAAWVSFEYLLNLISPHGTLGSLAYSQLNCLPVLQLASLTGPWGISFLVLLLPASFVASLQTRRPVFAGTGFGVLALALLFGAARLAQPVGGARVRVGLVASDAPAQVDVARAGEPTARLLEAYSPHVESLAARGAQVVVLPEKLGVLSEGTDALLKSLSDRCGVDLVVGLIQPGPHGSNQARIYAPGLPVRTYDKQHLLPAFESQFRPGSTLTLLRRPSGLWGVAICKDLDFTSPARDYGRVGTGLLLVPAWDFVVDRFEHGHKAVMRGVEGGFAVARAAKQGYLTVSDDRGRILAEAATDPSGFVTLVIEVPVVHHATLYQRWGDWFAWITLGLLAISLGRLRSR